jgi:Arm DNA-binding domain
MRRLNRLSDRFVRTAPIGKHHDGLGLLLQVTKGRGGDLNRSWLLRYSAGGGKSRYHGLGRFSDISLSTAREKAVSARTLLSDGVDPIAAKHAQRRALRQQQGRVMSFGECADAYMRAHWAAWTPRHAEQWRVTLDTYVMPSLGALPVDAIDTAPAEQARNRPAVQASSRLLAEGRTTDRRSITRGPHWHPSRR